VLQSSPAAPRVSAWSVEGDGAASLVKQPDGSVAIDDALGATIASLAPSATDAAGRPLPILISVAGADIVVTLASDVGGVVYPVEIHEQIVDQSSGAEETPAAIPAGSAWCDGDVSRPGMKIFSIATTTNTTIAWAAQWSPSATYGVDSLSSLGYQYVNGYATDQTYSKVGVYPQYTFHSHLKNYQIVGQGSRVHKIVANDYYQLFFQSTGNGFYGYATRGCWVE
jgi:hypothetical protein